MDSDSQSSTNEQTSQSSSEKSPLKVKQQYESVKDYQTTFYDLIKTEETHQETATTSWVADSAFISWYFKADILYGAIDLSNDQRKGINLRENMILRISSNKWSIEGYIKSIGDQKVTIACSSNDHPPNFNGYFQIQCVWNNIVFERMRDGLQKFQNDDLMSAKIRSLILGHDSSSTETSQESLANEPHVSQEYTELDRFSLNNSQKEAAVQALNEASMFLIQGPPGTGKTSTLTAIIAQLAENLKMNKSPDKILVCAPSNTAVDELAIRLVREGVEGLTRMYSLTKETFRNEHQKLKEVALHNQISGLDSKLDVLWDKKRGGGYLNTSDFGGFRSLKKKYEHQMFAQQRIICCTCSTAADKRLEGFDFKYVFIDEAAQAKEPECLLPLLFGAHKAILAGDHKQLGPVINSPEAKERNLDRTLFERMMSRAKHTMLTIQYRMHSLIAELPSKLFYEGRLETDKTVQRKFLSEGASKLFQKPVNFIELNGEEERSGTSWINKVEAKAIQKMIQGFLKSQISPEDIGIITPYAGQKRYLMEIIHKENGNLKEKLKIASVDEFQGGERKYIIISTVRSNNYGNIGFLSDDRRLNVAITRAKFGMVIYGNAKLLKSDDNWKQLVNFCEKNKVFYKM